jgi:hypothetical protein
MQENYDGYGPFLHDETCLGCVAARQGTDSEKRKKLEEIIS